MVPVASWFAGSPTGFCVKSVSCISWGQKVILVLCPIRLRVHTRSIWQSKSLIICSVQSLVSRWVALGGFRSCGVKSRPWTSLTWLPVFISHWGSTFLIPQRSRTMLCPSLLWPHFKTKQAKGLDNKKTVFIRIDMREICQAFEVLWRPAEMRGCLGTIIQKDMRSRLVALPLTGPNLEFQKCFRNIE